MEVSGNQLLPYGRLAAAVFVEASCRSEAEYYIQKHCGQDYMLVDKYDKFVAKILDYPEIPHDKF